MIPEQQQECNKTALQTAARMIAQQHNGGFIAFTDSSLTIEQSNLTTARLEVILEAMTTPPTSDAFDSLRKRTEEILESLPPLNKAQMLAITVLLNGGADAASSSALADYMMELGIDYVEEVKKKVMQEHWEEVGRRHRERRAAQMREMDERAARRVERLGHDFSQYWPTE